MAARKRNAKHTPAAPQSDADNDNPLQNAGPEDNETRVLRELEAEFGTGEEHQYAVRVSKVIDTPGRRAAEVGWLFDWNVEELESLRAKLASEEGPGRYRIVVTRDRENWKQYDIRIFRDLRPPRTIEPAAPIAPVTTDGLAPFERAVLTMMQEQQRQHAELLRAIANPRDRMSDMREMAELLRSVREVAGPENTGLQMFREGMTLMRDLMPAQTGGEGGGGLADIATRALDALPAILERLPMAQPQQPPHAMPQPIPQRASLPVTRQAPAPAGASPLPLELSKLKDFLLAKAQEGAQPTLFVDYTQGQLEAAGLVLDNVENPVDLLLQSFPELGPHRVWFEKLFEAMNTDDEHIAAGPLPADP